MTLLYFYEITSQNQMTNGGRLGGGKLGIWD